MAPGSVALYQSLQGQLAQRSDPAAAALDPAIRLSEVAPLSPGPRETLLIVARPDGTQSIETLPDALAQLLRLAEPGCTREDLLSRVRQLGADPGEDAEIVDELFSDGLLILRRAVA